MRTIEPRVLQVLVALVRAGGAVVARDELVARCWDGRIVTDHAINRVIARLRELASQTEGSFSIETISKVGYRLKASGASATPDPPPRTASRRAVIAAIAGGAGVIGLATFSVRGGGESPADELVRKGQDAMLQTSREQLLQALAYFRGATELDPNAATAWGGLALASQLAVLSGTERPRSAVWVKSLAEKALALDPANPDAKVALLLTQAWIGRWSAFDREITGLLARLPDHPFLISSRINFLRAVGRNREALALARQLVRLAPLAPGYRADLGAALRASDQLVEAQNVYDDAVRLWPQNVLLWMLRTNFYLLGGRPEAAAATLADASAIPLAAPAPLLDLMRAVAAGLRKPLDGESARTLRSRVVAQKGKVPLSVLVNYLCALGGVDEPLLLLEDYYFGEGAIPRPGAANRLTDFLFDQPARPLRDQPRFARILDRLGLEAYWRERGHPPDFRLAR